MDNGNDFLIGDQTIIDTVVERTQAVVCTYLYVPGFKWKYNYIIYVY